MSAKRLHTEGRNYNPAISAPLTWMLRTAIRAAMEYSCDKDNAILRLKKAFIKNPATKAGLREAEFVV